MGAKVTLMLNFLWVEDDDLLVDFSAHSPKQLCLYTVSRVCTRARCVCVFVRACMTVHWLHGMGAHTNKFLPSISFPLPQSTFSFEVLNKSFLLIQKTVRQAVRPKIIVAYDTHLFNICAKDNFEM